MRNVTSIDKAYRKDAPIAWFTGHVHQGYPSANEAYRYGYIFKYELEIPEGVRTLRLPQNGRIKIFAMTVAGPGEEARPLEPLYDNFQDDGTYLLQGSGK